MAVKSAGLLMYRRKKGMLEVFLVHPGGPFWARKDAGAWSIPKGEIGPDEEPLAAARREFEEETGIRAEGNFRPLEPVRLKSGKTIHAWAFEGDADAGEAKSNTFRMEWPPKSGHEQEFPEVDRAGWFGPEAAKEKINQSQQAFIEQLERLIEGNERNRDDR